MTAPTHWTVSGIVMSRKFITEDYDASFDLANEIKEIADDLEHHPDILITYNSVSVTTTTHSSNTLTDKDYDLAEAINEMYDTDESDDTPFSGTGDEDLDEEDDDDSDLDIGDEDVF